MDIRRHGNKGETRGHKKDAHLFSLFEMIGDILTLDLQARRLWFTGYRYI